MAYPVDPQNPESHIPMGTIDRWLYGRLLGDEMELVPFLIHCQNCPQCQLACARRRMIRIAQKAIGDEPGDLTEDCIDFSRPDLALVTWEEFAERFKPHLSVCSICSGYMDGASGKDDFHSSYQAQIFPPLGQRANPEFFNLRYLEQFF